MTKVTTVIELNGIKIAATTGDKDPETAKYIPIRLYKNEIIKLMTILK